MCAERAVCCNFLSFSLRWIGSSIAPLDVSLNKLNHVKSCDDALHPLFFFSLDH